MTTTVVVLVVAVLAFVSNRIAPPLVALDVAPPAGVTLSAAGVMTAATVSYRKLGLPTVLLFVRAATRRWR